MSSLALGRGLDYLELWLGARFTAAELAAADLLLQLSVAGAGRADEAVETSSATTDSSRRSASACLEDHTADAEEERVVEERALPLGSVDLDRRARKRYRLLSELYAATAPVTSAGSKKKKRLSSSSSEATRYGGDY